MALTKINNNTLSAVTTLPSAIATGKVLQVVQGTTSTETQTQSQTFVTTNISVAITPSSTSNKVLVFSSICIDSPGGSTNADNMSVALFRDSTSIFVPNADARLGIAATSVNPEITDIYPISYQDSPSSTSAISYNIRIRTRDGGVITLNDDGGSSSIIAMEIAG
tara:strand:- start:135 stop:629 length:495 start_codon:yes stop_codon:yes gene_type:complete